MGGEKEKKPSMRVAASNALTRIAPPSRNAALLLSRSHFRRLPQRAASPTTAVHHFTPQLAEEKLKGEINSSYHGGAHQEGARQDEAAGVHLCRRRKTASRRVKEKERRGRVRCAKYTSVIPGARILLVGASVNGRPCLSGAKVPLRRRCCAPCSPLDNRVTTTPPTAEGQAWSGERVRFGRLPARKLHAPLGFKGS